MTARLPLPAWGALIALALVIACLFEPKARIGHIHHRYLFVLDITESMNVSDVILEGASVRRLDLARAAMRHALTKLHCDSSVGLAIFTEHRSFLLNTPVPVCDNFTDLVDVISHMDWRMAWRSQSEVAKGLNSAIDISGVIDPPARIVFFTDGHEAPPIHPDFRRRVHEGPFENPGVMVGVGGDEPVPIPRFDEEGEKTGYWHPSEVEQHDVYTVAVQEGQSLAGVGPNPLFTGHEHLSRLEEGYLRELAAEGGLGYHRLTNPGALADLLDEADYGERVQSRQDLRPLLLMVALGVFVAGFAASALGSFLQARQGARRLAPAPSPAAREMM